MAKHGFDPVIAYRHFRDRGVLRTLDDEDRRDLFASAIDAAIRMASQFEANRSDEGILTGDRFATLKREIHAKVGAFGESFGSTQAWIRLPEWKVNLCDG